MTEREKIKRHQCSVKCITPLAPMSGSSFPIQPENILLLNYTPASLSSSIQMILLL